MSNINLNLQKHNIEVGKYHGEMSEKIFEKMINFCSLTPAKIPQIGKIFLVRQQQSAFFL